MLIARLQSYVASNADETSPPCVTVGFSGLQDNFDLTSSHAVGFDALDTIIFYTSANAFLTSAWTTDENAYTSNPPFSQLPIIPHQHEAFEHARGVFDPNTVVIYGGRGFAVPARVEPTVVAYGIGPSGFNQSGGQGGEFQVTLEPVQDENDSSKTSHWRIASASATAGLGSGYGSMIVVATGESLCASSPTLSLQTARGEPRLTARASTSGCNCAGSGAQFEIAYQKVSTSWQVTSINVTNGGSGYGDSGFLIFSHARDGFGSLPQATFQASGGVITAVEITSPGASYTDRVPTGVVTVTNPGAYYKEDRSLPAYTYSDYQSQYGLTVDTNLSSTTFGQVTAGPSYESLPSFDWRCRNGCLSSYNGREYVLCGPWVPGFFQKPLSRPATWLCVQSPWGSDAAIEIVIPLGYDNQPTGIESATVTNFGRNYAQLARVEPSPNFFVSGGGSGAAFSHQLSESVDEFGLPVWSIESISVSGGSGYTDRSFVSLGVPGIAGRREDMILNTKRLQPTISASVCQIFEEGQAASLSTTLASTGGINPVWGVASVTVDDAGQGYRQGAPVLFTVTSPNTRTISAACGTIEVDEAGGIVSVSILSPGEYYQRTDEPDNITVEDAGAFYARDSSLPAIVAPITVAVSQNGWNPQGSGATFSVGVDDDPASPGFGKITPVTVVTPGEGYTLLAGGGTDFARLLPTRVETDAPVLPPFDETESSTYYINQTFANGPYTIRADLTSPDCNGVRKASIIIFEPNGYTTEDGFRLPGTAMLCGRAFVGEGSGHTIQLSPVDGGPGSAFLRLDGDSSLLDSTNCEARIEDDCNICRAPLFGIDEASGVRITNDPVPRLYPLIGGCQYEGEVEIGQSPPQSVQYPAYWATFDDNGAATAVFKVCGRCDDGFSEIPPAINDFSPTRRGCECNLDGFCLYKPVWDSDITPVFVPNVGYTNCGDGSVELERSTCANPLP